MPSHMAGMHLSDHCAGAPTSPAQPLWLPDLPEICLLAYGCSSAAVVVQNAQASSVNTTALSEHNVHNHNVAIPCTVLRMNPTAEPAEAVSSVAWSSQGVESKLAAVTASTLAVFSLEHYISAIVQQTPLVQPHPGQTPTCQAQHTCPLVALSWTQEGDGLLSADTQGCIIMWRITSTTNQSQQLTQAWLGGNSTVVQPQSILAAGANILSPSASACPGTKHVTIWWPEELQQGEAQPAVPVPAAKDAGAQPMVAVAEQLRHPVGVVVAQWSPGSLQHGSSFTSSEVDGSPLAATAQPALMTVGYDGMIRIWVEVTLSPSLGAQAPGSPSRLVGPSTPSSPGTPANQLRGHQLLGSSQFCLTLVVQPPNSTLIGFQPDSLRACWGVPCQGPLGPSNRMAAGSVLWILAMVDGAQQAKAADSEAESEKPSDQLLLWAVEGLAGVVINGIPNNVPGTRALNTPKAVLWGQHDALLRWPDSSTPPIAERQLACHVSLEDDSPVLHVVESCSMTQHSMAQHSMTQHSMAQHSGITLRKYALHSVDEDASHTPSQQAVSAASTAPPRQLLLHDYTTQTITGHQSPITCLATHPSQPLAFTADQMGLTMLWHTGPLTPLGGLIGLLGAPPAAVNATLVSAACWLGSQAGPKEVEGVLAVATASKLVLVQVTMRSGKEGTGLTAALQPLGQADLPTDYPCLAKLCPLSYPPPSDPKSPGATTSDATSGHMSHHMLVGSLMKAPHASQQQLQSQSLTQTRTPKCIDAISIWQVMSRQGQGQGQGHGQGQGQQPLPEGNNPGLMLCHVLQSPVGHTCVVPVKGAGHQLILGDAHGGMQLVSVNMTEQKAKLATERSLPSSMTSSGWVRDLALTDSGSHIAVALCGQSGRDSCLQIWQAESAPPDSLYVIEAAVFLPEAPTAVAWLPSCGVTPTACVACSSSTLILSQSHDQGWTVIASLGSLGQPLGALQLDCKGLPMVTAGNQLGLVSNLVQAHTTSSSSGSPSQLLQIPLGQLALELAGPLPDYAPGALALMIARGRTQAARDVIRHLLAWLTLHDPSSQTPHSALKPSGLEQQLLPDAPLDALLHKPCLEALSSLVNALPLSLAPAEAQELGSTTAAAQQQQQPAGTGQISAARHRETGYSKSSTPAPTQQAQAVSKASADPFAFDAGAFGMGNTADSEDQEEQQPPPPQPDPFAFDAGAFGGDHEEGEAQPPPAQADKDPFAFDAGAFGMTDVQPEEDEEEQKAAAAPADPFAFDPGAFGFSGEEQPQQPHAVTAPPAASASVTVSAAAADPFAFNPDAFGFSSAPEEEAQPEVAPAEEPAGAAAGDPYAFDAGAFGMGVPPSRKSEEQSRPEQQAQGGQDPFAFDAGAFGMGPSSAPPKHEPKSPDTKLQPAPAQPARKPKAAATHDRSSLLQSSSIQILRPKKSSSAPTQPAALSSAELGSLQKLLGMALSQPGSSEEEPTSPTSPAGLTNRLASALPPGLAPHSTRVLLSIAHMLCDDPPLPHPSTSQQGGAAVLGKGTGTGSVSVDWAALDEAARKAIRAVQLAVCSLLSVSGSSISHGEVTTPRSREVLDGLMAAPRNTDPSQPGTASKAAAAVLEKDESWGADMGVIRGLSTCALMWALLSESQDVLLTQTINQLPVVDQEGGLAPPEFGFATSSPSATPGAARGSALTWEAMRQVGAGFWLTDQQVVVARAEALAKAQFAHRRDPHDCALTYLALKKKQLLMSLFRGANHKKQADFLMRDFSQDAHKDAACKNAYTLLGQHRHELAAAFFVLGGAFKDAVGVCAHELGDPQLALFLARILEGGQSPLQQHLLSQELLPGAQDKQDSWAVCLITWLQGQPAAALQELMPQPQPDQATSSSDRSIAPGQLNTNPPSTSGRSHTSALPSCNPPPLASHHPSHNLGDTSDHAASASQAGKHWDQALALDLLAYCLTPGSVTWAGQSPTLGQLGQLATEAAHALEVTGHPVMALEALQTAQKCCKRIVMETPTHSDSGQPQSSALQQQQILNSWQDRLVTACLMRCLIEATQPEALPDPLLPPTAPLNPQDAQHLISQRWTLHRNRALAVTPMPSPTQWKKLAQQQLKILADAGISVDAGQAMIRLQTMYDSLLAKPHAGAEKGGVVEMGGPGLFRSISGISTLSTPRRNSTFSSGVMSSGLGAVFDDSHRLLHVDSDRLHAVCASNAGVYGYAGAEARPFAAASVKHGIVVGEVSMMALPATAARQSEDGRHHHAASDSGSKGTTFSAMLGDMLEAVRWPQDPSSAPSSPFGRGGVAKGAKPESPSATRIRVPVGQIGTSTLAPHPTRQLFLTGCASGEIYLCQFGETKAKAGYTPMPAHLEAPAPSPQSLFTTPPRSWNQSPGVNFTHWGQPQAVCWSDDGERFAGLGDGGVVATWRLDAPRMAASDTAYLGRSDWCHQGLSKRGMDVTYLGSGSSVLAVAGQCSQGGNIVIWDTQRPLTSGPIARLSHHLAAVTALKVLPGSQLLASADEQGNIAVKDLRMLGGSSQQPPRAGAHKGLPPPTTSPNAAPGAGSSWGSYSGNAAARGLVWEVRGAHQGQGVVRMIAGLRPLSDGTTGGSMMVTGGRDGSINVWSCHRGRHLQAIEKAHAISSHSSKGRNFFTDAFRSKSFGGPPAVVTGLALTADGLLSCGLDGNVKVHPFL